jgi:hypothetical protein
MNLYKIALIVSIIGFSLIAKQNGDTVVKDTITNIINISVSKPPPVQDMKKMGLEICL